MTRIFAAAAILASAIATTGTAQTMDEGLSMLELAVNNELAKVGVRDADIQALSLSQLAIIKGILESDDSDNQKMRRVEAVLSR